MSIPGNEFEPSFSHVIQHCIGDVLQGECDGCVVYAMRRVVWGRALIGAPRRRVCVPQWADPAAQQRGRRLESGRLRPDWVWILSRGSMALVRHPPTSVTNGVSGKNI